MFIRTTRTRRGDKVYSYPQLVESYRKANGKPAHKVVASLKDWSPEAIEGLRIALAAAREGKAVVPVDQIAKGFADKHVVAANLAYLSVAVLMVGWSRWRLGELLDKLLPEASIVPHSQALQALVLHRCVAPDSKRAACTWYPTTALPELLGVKPRYLNNSRVHRALGALSQAEEALQDGLAQRLAAAPGGVVATYLDLTDTWFVGRGPPMSRRGKTKEGLLREKVGIALLCDQRGFPLRWRTCQGNRYEPRVMLELLREARAAGSLGEAPVVMDRAMGRGAHLEALSDADVTWVSALTRRQYRTFVPEGPWDRIGNIELLGSPNTRKRELQQLGQLAREAGMEEETADGRFLLDLGVDCFEREEGARAPALGGGAHEELMREVLFMEEALASGWVPTLRALARWYGCSPKTLHRVRHLRYLDPAIRERVLQGEAELLTLDELLAVADKDADKQSRSFGARLAFAERQGRKPAVARTILDLQRQRLLLRRVAYFSPDLLLRRHATARKRLDRLHDHVELLNQEQRDRPKPRGELHLLADMRRYLDKLHWIDAFDVSTRLRRGNGRSWHELVIERNEDEWKRRRRLDGFGVVVAHPGFNATAAELVGLYFSKDIVEKDFQTIKSELDLRPVRHRTDPKVQAHVSLCMLALLLQRSLEQDLARGGLPGTAAAATQTLATSHLNRLEPAGARPYYSVTAASPQQREILVALDLEHLVDDRHVGGTIRPR